jgi:hypothetical protein
MSDLVQRLMPPAIHLQLVASTKALPDRPGWYFEPKKGSVASSLRPFANEARFRFPETRNSAARN